MARQGARSEGRSSVVRIGSRYRRPTDEVVNAVSDHQRFIDNEIFQLTLAAVTQRGGVYRPNLPESARRELHVALRESLTALGGHYTSAVADDAHIANIDALAQRLSSRCHNLLVGSRFRIGNAQKALNLHLKYRWCLGLGAEPPHCPFDAIVLRQIPGWRARRWTRLDSLDQYRNLVAAARACANPASLAVWELNLYNASAQPRPPAASPEGPALNV